MVAHFASESFKFYDKGVFNGEGCKGEDLVNHSSTLVGYNLENDPPYYLFKNGWGLDWGE